MTREQCKQFISSTFGIEEGNVTDDMITSYLNNVNGAVKAEKERADALKKDADLAKSLQSQLDAINAEKMTDIEKANKETEKANEQIAGLQKQIKAMEVKTKLAELGITGEQAEKFFMDDGGLNFEILGQVISDREKQASALKEKEILKGTPNPNGGNDNPETQAEAFAKGIGQKMAESNKAVSDVMSHYVK